MTTSAFTRRHFLQTGTAAAVGLSFGLPRPGIAAPVWGVLDPDPHGQAKLQTPAVHAVVMRALDAARSAGARYADVRVTYTRTCIIRDLPPKETIVIGIGVRALVDGVWGWASSSHVLPDEGARLGQQAVAMAKSIASRDVPRVIDFEPVPVITDSWAAPVRIDPFGVTLEEVIDWGQGLDHYIKYYRKGAKAEAFGGNGDIAVSFRCQERLFASTDGSVLSQTFNDFDYTARVEYLGIARPLRSVQSVDLTSPRTFGWEIIADAHFQRSLPAVLEEIEAEAAQPLPTKPFDIGRFDLLVSADLTAQLLEKTLAPATQVDRALGYEANAGGTSYLGPDPLAVLGTTVTAPAVTLTANRSRPGAAATVRWDDEGVAPADFPIINKGILVDYQTTREQAAWLKAWYTKQGVPVHSHGCAWSEDATAVPMQHTPNLVMEPDTADHTLESLRAGMATGIEVVTLKPFSQINVDQQCLNGFAAIGLMYEIRRGKRVAQLTGPLGVQFRSPEFWKSVLAVGGTTTQERYTVSDPKGQPEQRTDYSIDAVPVVVKQQAVIDYTRKA